MYYSRSSSPFHLMACSALLFSNNIFAVIIWTTLLFSSDALLTKNLQARVDALLKTNPHARVEDCQSYYSVQIQDWNVPMCGRLKLYSQAIRRKFMYDQKLQESINLEMISKMHHNQAYTFLVLKTEFKPFGKYVIFSDAFETWDHLNVRFLAF
jgi:hypothetical protein